MQQAENSYDKALSMLPKPFYMCFMPRLYNEYQRHKPGSCSHELRDSSQVG
jgi:hypothetical protein